MKTKPVATVPDCLTQLVETNETKCKLSKTPATPIIVLEKFQVEESSIIFSPRCLLVT